MVRRVANITNSMKRLYELPTKEQKNYECQKTSMVHLINVWKMHISVSS